MQSIKRMIDRALASMATESEIAARLGVPAQRLNDWKSGRRSMPDAAIIELAFIAGLDAKRALGDYHYERHEKKPGGALAGIAALAFSAVAVGGGLAYPSDATAADASHRNTHYAQRVRTLRSLFAWLRRVVAPLRDAPSAPLPLVPFAGS